MPGRKTGAQGSRWSCWDIFWGNKPFLAAFCLRWGGHEVCRGHPGEISRESEAQGWDFSGGLWLCLEDTPRVRVVLPACCGTSVFVSHPCKGHDHTALGSIPCLLRARCLPVLCVRPALSPSSVWVSRSWCNTNIKSYSQSGHFGALYSCGASGVGGSQDVYCYTPSPLLLQGRFPHTEASGGTLEQRMLGSNCWGCILGRGQHSPAEWILLVSALVLVWKSALGTDDIAISAGYSLPLKMDGG